MFNIIPLIIILVSLSVIVAVIIKKFPLLAGFDVSSIPEEKEVETKKKIMEERLTRKIKVYYQKIIPFFKIISNFFSRKIKSLQEKIKKWEEQYNLQAKKEALVTKEEFQTLEAKISNLLKEANELIDKESYNEAENKLIEIIRLEPRNIEAYRGLGQIYFSQKQYEDAKQTFNHILKLNKADSFANFELAEVFAKMENYEEAIVNLEKALVLEPNNPKYLDLLITISLIIKDKNLAKQILNRLKEANPDNAKIEEFQAQIKEM